MATEVRRSRVGAGLSQRTVGASVGVSHMTVGRFERNANGLTIDVIGGICAVVGLDLVIRAYPGGDALRDVGQLRLLDRLSVRRHPTIRWVTEVPLPIPGDRRAWDAMLIGDGWRVAVEAETVLDDLQALERRLELKRRDGEVDHVILLVSDTPRNRNRFAARQASLSTVPPAAAAILEALRRGTKPPSGTIFL